MSNDGGCWYTLAMIAVSVVAFVIIEWKREKTRKKEV